MVWHVLLVRRRGVVPPIDAVAATAVPVDRATQTEGRVMSAPSTEGQPTSPPQEWTGPWRRYDIVKEGVIAVVVVSILTVLMAACSARPTSRS